MGCAPGLNYTLIAEYQGEDGMMSGRVQAKAPDTGVRIGLGARDPETESEPRGAKFLQTRIRSTLFPEDQTDGFPAAARPRAQAASADAEDQDPPAEEATSGAQRTRTSVAGRLASGTSSATRGGWSARQGASSDPSTRSRAAADADETPNGPPSPGNHGGTSEDDGDNPLPPALEPRDATVMRTDGSDSRASARPPRQIPDDALPRSTGIATASYSRRAVGSDGEGEEADATTRKASNVRRRSRTASASSSRPRDPGVSTDASDPGARPRITSLDHGRIAAPPGANSRSVRTTCRWTRRFTAARPKERKINRAASSSPMDGRTVLTKASRAGEWPMM